MAPKTEAGKHKSSLNALRHGLTGQVVVLPSEDLTAYGDFTRKFFDDLQPSGIVETQLVQVLGDDSWRLNRAKAMEDNILALGFDAKSSQIETGHPEAHAALAIALAAGEQTKALNKLSLHQSRLTRNFHLNLKKLEQIQAARHEKEAAELAFAGIRSSTVRTKEPP